MPLIVSRTNAAAIASSGGNSRGGNRPGCATVSQMRADHDEGKRVARARGAAGSSSRASAGDRGFGSSERGRVPSTVCRIVRWPAPDSHCRDQCTPMSGGQLCHWRCGKPLQCPRPVIGQRPTAQELRTWPRKTRRKSAGSAWAAWASRWPSGSSRPATTSRSGIAPAPRPSRCAKIGGKVVDHLSDLKDVDVLFSIVATGKDVQDVLYGKNGVCSQGGKMPPIVVDCSTIAVEESAAIRDKLKQLGADFVAAPVSGNAKVIKAGKLSAVVSGPEAACKTATPLIEVFAPQRRVLCGRRRARARLQDRPQRHARRRHRESDRDHAARPTRWACRATPSWPSSTTA